MKKLILSLAFIVTFFLGILGGIYYEMPKQFVNHDLEKTYVILSGYGNWKSSISTDSGKTYHSSEIKLSHVPIQYGFGVSCEDGSMPTYKLYSSFGNSNYAKQIGFIGGNFDGYFNSIRVVDCKDHYFINENGDAGIYYGPFYFSPKNKF